MEDQKKDSVSEPKPAGESDAQQAEDKKDVALSQTDEQVGRDKLLGSPPRQSHREEASDFKQYFLHFGEKLKDKKSAAVNAQLKRWASVATTEGLWPSSRRSCRANNRDPSSKTSSTNSAPSTRRSGRS